MLKKIAYVSSASGPLSAAELAEILTTSKRNNQRVGVTGMLLYHDGNFMQVLEGASEDVDAVFARVENDPRHHGVLKLLEWQEDVRQFPHWSMGLRNLDELSLEDSDGVSEFLRTSLLDEEYRTNPDTARRLLLGFRNRLR